MVLYVPGTEETDPKKQNMSLQQIGGATSTNTTNIATNTTAIAALNAATYVNSIAGNHGAFTLSHGLTNSTNDIQRALNESTLQASPSNPTGTTSATGVMMGLGATCHLTPTYSGRVLLRFQGTAANTVSTANIAVQARYGTSTAPSNAAALTGTTIGSAVAPWAPAANGSTAFAVGGIITGLTPGTAYWFDLSIAASTGTATITGVSCSAMEF